jgi:uncharacterized iron-regulated protein
MSPSRNRRRRWAAVALGCLGVVTLVSAQGPAVATIVNGRTGRTESVAGLLEAVQRADALFIGERHDRESTHRYELTLLRLIAERRHKVSLLLEMFERDVQEPLEHFGMGHLSERELLLAVRPWPQYARDYKPLVDLAVAKEWSLIAGSLPRSLAARIARDGLAVLDSASGGERAWFARERQCPTDDADFGRFRQVIHAQPSAVQTPPASSPASEMSTDSVSLERYYFAQCVKDETMAESIASAHAAGSIGGGQPLIISINGAFHSDFGGGVVSRTRRRLPKASIVTVTLVEGAAPVAGPDARADFIVDVHPE